MSTEKLLKIYLDDRNRTELYRYAVMLTGNPEDAGDLVADLAVLIYTNESFHNAREPMAYFKTCMRYAFYNRVRKQIRVTEIPPDLLGAEFADDAPNGAYEDDRARSILRDMLSEYPREWVNAFEAFYLDGYSQKELARSLGVSVNALTQRFRRMRGKLKKQKTTLYLSMLLLMIHTIGGC